MVVKICEIAKYTRATPCSSLVSRKSISKVFTCLVGCVPLVGYQENESEERRDGSREGEGQQVFPDPVPLDVLVHQKGHEAEGRRRLVQHDGQENNHLHINLES